MLNFLSAAELSVKLQSRAVSAREVLDAHLVQIERVNSKVNAIVTLDGEGAYRQANAIDARRMKGEALSPLAGLPIACKDMERVKGMRTTFGSPIYKDNVADIDTLMVERFRRHGMVIIGKTNTPEFALGSQTFNTVFGKTLNPWDVTKTCGGSSGGAAVAVATRMLPFADGSDLGASLRNPANFCNVVGVRPTPGRVRYRPARRSTVTLPPGWRHRAGLASWLGRGSGQACTIGEPFRGLRQVGRASTGHGARVRTAPASVETGERRDSSQTTWQYPWYRLSLTLTGMRHARYCHVVWSGTR